MSKNKIIKLVNANYINDYVVELLFDDGVVQTIDFGNFLNNHPRPQYDKYKDLKKLNSLRLKEIT